MKSPMTLILCCRRARLKIPWAKNTMQCISPESNSLQGFTSLCRLWSSNSCTLPERHLLLFTQTIRILAGCCVLNLLYQLDLSLVEVCFVYTLRVVLDGRMSMSAQSPRLQFVIGLPNSPKTGVKGMILLRGP